MNSMAQQAVPNGIGQMEDLRPHLTTASRLVVMMSPPAWTDGYRVGSSILPRKMSSSPMATVHHIVGGKRRASGYASVGLEIRDSARRYPDLLSDAGRKPPPRPDPRMETDLTCPIDGTIMNFFTRRARGGTTDLKR